MTTDREQAAYRFARGVLRPPLMALTRRDWRGQEHLPPSGGCVVVTNHISHFDPLTFAHYVNDAGRAPRFLGKASVFAVPGVGAILLNAGQIPVYRESRDATAAFRAAVAAVEEGECVAIYPEATLTRDPDLWPMLGKTGAARVALVTGCPVVPIAQWGAHHVLRPYAKVPHLLPRKTMHVWAGAPVDLSDLRGQELTSGLLRDAAERIIGAVTDLLAQIRGETPPAERYDPRRHDLPRTGNPHRRDHEEGS